MKRRCFIGPISALTALLVDQAAKASAVCDAAVPNFGGPVHAGFNISDPRQDGMAAAGSPPCLASAAPVRVLSWQRICIGHQ